MTTIKGATDALLPCPFDNGKGFVSRNYDPEQSFQVFCETCGSCTGIHETAEEAECAWNTRADITPSLIRVIELAEDALQPYAKKGDIKALEAFSEIRKLKG